MTQLRLASHNLTDFSFAELERMAHIEFMLVFAGSISVDSVTTRFRVSTKLASDDLKRYQRVGPGNIKVANEPGHWARTDTFKPVFQGVALRLLSTLTQGFGDGLLDAGIPDFGIETAPELQTPNIWKVAGVTTAVLSRAPVRIKYMSFASGETEREIVPHALASNGTRWHVRAYDRRRRAFLDFVINRILSIDAVHDIPTGPELGESDVQWNEWISLTLKPHPAIDNPVPIELDHGMNGGQRVLRVRKALAGYTLAHWAVDCSAQHSLESRYFRLALANPGALAGVDSADLAPGR